MIINLLNELCGARLTFNYMRVGGVKWDAPDGWIEKVEEFVPYMREQLAGYHDLVSGNEIFLNRVKGVGIYKRGRSDLVFFKRSKFALHWSKLGSSQR